MQSQWRGRTQPRTIHCAIALIALLNVATMHNCASGAERPIVLFESPVIADSAGASVWLLEDCTFSLETTEDSLSTAGTWALCPVFPDCDGSELESINAIGEPITLLDMSRYYYVLVDSTIAIDAVLIQRLRAVPGVQACYLLPSPEVTAPESESSTPGAYDAEWWLNNIVGSTCGFPSVPGIDINAPEAWQIANGTESVVKVAVLSTGIQSTHPSLLGRVDAGYSFLYDGMGELVDLVGEGTKIAALIGANGANPDPNYAGVSWGCRFMPYKVKTYYDNHEQSARFEERGEAIRMATKKGNRIIHVDQQWKMMTLDGIIEVSADPQFYACANALLHGSLVVAPSWRDQYSEAMAPAAYDKMVLAVGAVDATGKPWGGGGPGPNATVPVPRLGEPHSSSEAAWIRSSDRLQSGSVDLSLSANAGSPACADRPTYQRPIASKLGL